MENLRTVLINKGRPKEKAFNYCTNAVFTTKYNLLTFIPRFLFEQFSRYANLFFISIALIQQIPGITPTHRFAVALPLLLIQLVTAVKELVEDQARRKADDRTNNAICAVYDYSSSSFLKTKWKAVRVGDLVKIEDGEFFPADLALLQTSFEEGICHIETANIDGETNLKAREVPPQLMLATFKADDFTGMVRCEPPNNRVNEFDGLMLVGSTEVPLGIENICLRGARLQNSDWIVGVVIYTGIETKLVQNTQDTPTKRSSIDNMTNRQISYLIALLFSCSLLGLIGNMLVNRFWVPKLPYLRVPGVEGVESELGIWGILKTFATFVILLYNLVPISLLVTLEIIRVRLGQLIESDLELYCEESDTPAAAKTTCLIEELGQVQYIFSDKTGTLTRNEMILRSIVKDGELFELPAVESKDCGWLLIYMAACNTTVLGKGKNGKVVYQSSSPDEVAICLGASALGVPLIERRRDMMMIRDEVRGVTHEFQILTVLDFDSIRKRMSIVLRDVHNGKRIIITKGADTSMLPLMNPKQSSQLISDTEGKIEKMALNGLRTLVFGSRVIGDEEWNSWHPLWQGALAQLDGGAAIEGAMSVIERDFDIVGVTGVEDRLQEGVPETIVKLQDANLNIWVLTGDKVETAINIGYSCGLLRKQTEVMRLGDASQLPVFLSIVQKGGSVESVSPNTAVPREDTASPLSSLGLASSVSVSTRKSSKAVSGVNKPIYALVVEGKTLDWVLADSELGGIFVNLSKRCHTVICCRVTPLQKAQVVTLIQKRVKAVCLAIGDGANDVEMIQAAQIGVGINGKEGLQAARSADFAIAQFRFLQRLLLVHGSCGYLRISKAATYSIYKNIFIYLVQFWYIFFNLFSGTSLYESWMLGLYNVIFTALPPAVLGLTNQFVTDKYLLSHPQVYKLGQDNLLFNNFSIWGAVGNAVMHSLLSFGIGLIGTSLLVFPGGKTITIDFLGTTIFAGILLTTALKAALLIHHWTILATIGLILTPVSFFAYVLAYDGISRALNMPAKLTALVGIPAMMSSVVFWLTIVLIPSVCLIGDYVWKYYQRQYMRHEYHVIQDLQRQDKKRRRAAELGVSSILKSAPFTF